MISAAILSLMLIIACVLFHYEVLRLLHDHLPRAALILNRAKVLAAFCGAMVSHLCQIALFATAYYLLRDKFGLGVFEGRFRDAFSSFLYFSAETYTTLGFATFTRLGHCG